MGGNEVHVKDKFRHLSFVPESNHNALLSYCVGLMIFALVIIIMDLWSIYEAYQAFASSSNEEEGQDGSESPLHIFTQAQANTFSKRSAPLTEKDKAVKQTPVKQTRGNRAAQKLLRSYSAEMIQTGFTVLMCIIIIIYAAFCLQAYHNSEDRTKDMVSGVISLYETEDKLKIEALQEFNDSLEEAAIVSTFAFCMMV